MSANAHTEDRLVEQPAIQLMQHELGWNVVNCFDEWNGGVSNQGRDGKREGEEILNVEFWILNGRGRRKKVSRRVDFLISLKTAISPSAETADFTEIECLQDFTESTSFTAC